jgi:hypothetical protein
VEKAEFGAEYVNSYRTEDLKNFIRDYDNWWWNLKNLAPLYTNTYCRVQAIPYVAYEYLPYVAYEYLP